jgi:DNA modification methylase
VLRCLVLRIERHKMTEKVVIGNATLYHGDCREVLPLLPAHDLLCTDPPYGIGQDGGAQRTRGSKRTNGDKLGWDNERPKNRGSLCRMGCFDLP